VSPSVRAAATPDAKLAVMVVAEAKRVVRSEEQLLHPDALPVLQRVVGQVASGLLPREDWQESMAELADMPLQPACHGMAGLIQSVQGSIPVGAQARRVLWRRLLLVLTELARPPLGLAGLVQLPFLASLGQPPPPCSEPSIERELFLAAARLARRGDQRGARHGCILVEGPVDAHASSPTPAGSNQPSSGCDDDGDAVVGGRLILGCGWNHEVVEQRGGSRRKRVLHAEVHAVADAIRRRGERHALDALQRCTAYIVELRDDAAYDDAPPCRKCRSLLQALGVPHAAHSTRDGRLARMRLPPAKPDLLALPMACQPLCYACDSMSVHCERLEAALLLGKVEPEDDGGARALER
jgi:deoxycytidylate deaminase